MVIFTKSILNKTFVFYSTLFAFLFLGLSFGKAQSTQTITTTGTWVCPTGVTTVTVTCIGAGGGGGGAATTNPSSGGGGGGGGYATGVLAVTAGTTYNVTVGTGGTAGAASATQAGTGGPSWFNTAATIYADGGKGGWGSVSAAAGTFGAGGTANIGTTVQNGGTGTAGVTATYGGAGGGGADGTNASPTCDASGSTAGAGGTNNGGAGGSGQAANSNGNGGNTYGGGASGAHRTSGSRTGGVGANGVVLLTYVCPVIAGGTYKIGGVSPDYATLTAAFAAITCGGITGNVNLVLQSGYTSASETFPLTPATNNGTYSVTIYPAVSGLSITSNNAVATMSLSGCSNYVIDGRVNQAGATNLVIANTNTSGAAIEFISDATYNTIQYCDVQGIETQYSAGIPTSGVIYFSTAASSGNSHNTITNCNIHAGASTPSCGILSTGTAAFPNSTNTISNCNIYDFYIASAPVASGIDLEAGNTAWTISGNSFYQTSSRVPTASSGFFVIQIENNTGTNYVISGNYIGGTAASCGGGALTFDAGLTQDNYFYGMFISVGGNTASFIQNNTVANIAFGSKCQAGSASTIEFAGIVVAGGYVSVTNNTVGSTTGTGSIAVSLATTSTQAFNFEGIFITGTQGGIENNNVGSITLSGGKTNKLTSIRGLDCEGALVSDFGVSNNVIGSKTTANSIQYSGGTANQVSFSGIFLSTTGATLNTNVFNNTVQNITNTGSATTIVLGAITGIYDLSTSLGSITTNTVANMTTAVGTTNDIIGFYIGNTTAGQTISNNVIHDLSNTYVGATQDDVYGIYYAGPTSGANAISANAVYNLTLSGATNTASTISGISIASGLATTSNNMVTLGNGVTTGYTMYGINMASSTAGNNFYFNSVYIGGAASAAGANTNCFNSSVNSTRTVENNIFYNARTQTAGAGNHYAIDVSSATGLTSNYNDLYTSVAANCGSYNGGGTARTFANWKTGITGDGNSINSDPTFSSPTAATPDIHIGAASPVIGVGLNGLGISIDFDGNARNNPPSMGADENHKNYYSKSSGNLDVLGTWGTNTDGSGTSPANFTSTQCTYNIRNNAAPTLGASWTVSGTGSNIVLGDGTTACNFTIPGAFSCTGSMNVSNNGTLTNQNAVNPTLVILNSGSTVNYNAASGVNQTVFSPITYGNLTLSNSTGSGSTTKTLGATISIAGNLTISRYTTFDMVAYNANRTSGGGILSCDINGTLKLSGAASGASTTNNFPNNFATMTLVASSTVEYYSATAQNIYPSVTYGNLTTTTGVKTAGGALTIASNLTINAGSTFAGSTYTHILQGDFLNSGTFTANTSTMNFNNTSGVLQHIGPAGGSTTTFATLKINNTAGVTMQQDANVSTALTLSAGLLNTFASGSGLLIMQSGSTATAITAASTTYVNGPMQYQKASSGSSTLNFPIGTSPDCRPFILTVNHSAATQYNYNAQTFNADPWVAMNSGSPYIATNMPTTVDTISGVHYWTIARTDASNTPTPATGLSGNQQIQLYFGTNDGVYQGSNLTIVKNTAATPAAWIDIGGTCALGNSSSGQAGSVTSTSSPSTFTSFSSFTLGSKNTGWDPLPIELLSFNAVANGDKVDVKWETITETNNAYFTVEKSKDGKTFTKLIDVPGAGTSTNYRDYAEADYQPYEGTSYYRLKQTDFNGKSTYFNMVPVTFMKEGQQSIVVYPNPMRENANDVNVKLMGYQGKEVVVVLRSIEGKEYLSKVLFTEEDDHIFILDNTRSLPPGTYIVTASSNDKIYNCKLIVK